MKKRILALLSVMLLALLMTVAVSAADPTLELATPGTGVDYSALKEGQSFDVYVLVPVTKIGTSNNYIYRVSEDTAGLAVNKTNGKLSNFALTVTWDKKSLTLSNAELLGTASSSLVSAGDGYYFAFLVKDKLATAQGATPTKNDESGTLALTYGADDTNGFVVRSVKGTAPEKGVIAKLTFRVITGAEGGDNLPITLNRRYTFNGTNVTASPASQSKVTVSVEAGCKHADKTPLTPEQLLANGKENIDATCLVEGQTWYQCNDECGDIIVVTSPKLKHDFTVVGYLSTNVPTCDKGGIEAMFCSTEGCTEHDPNTETPVEKLGHSFKEELHAYRAPSCSLEGYEYYWCERCGIISPTGSKDNLVSVFAVGGVLPDGEIPAEVSLGMAHTFSDDVIATLDPTCTETGYSVHYCAECGIVSPTGSNDDLLEITYSEGVFSGELPENIKIPAIGHSWVYDRSDSGVDYYCCENSGCNEEKSITAEDAVVYVAQNGTGDGKTAETPTDLATAFDMLSDMPADVDCKIYLIGTVVLPNRQVSSENTVAKSFEETKHVAKITIATAPNKSTAELQFPFTETSMYFLYGPTVFDNIKISSTGVGTSAGDSPSINIVARGFELTMTNKVKTVGSGTITQKKTDGSFSLSSSVTLSIPNCKLYLLGGIYSNGGYEGRTDNEGIDVTMHVNGGAYWVVTGLTRSENILAKNATIDIHIGEKAQIGQLLSVNAAKNADVDGTVANIHYHGTSDVKIPMVYVAQNHAVKGHYTVNHLFYAGSKSLKIGDFMMGAKHDKTVNIYYARFDKKAKDFADSVNDKLKKYLHAYGISEHEFNGLDAWCGRYLGHDYVDGICSFCGITECDHPSVERVVVSTPTCTTAGLEREFCTYCYAQIGEDIITEISPEVHDYAWVLPNKLTADTEITSKCVRCGAVRCTYKDFPTTLYVSDKGYGDGGFTPDYPLNDFTTAMRIASVLEDDVTVYIVGKITVKDNFGTSTHTVFTEYNHTNHITISGYNGSGVFAFPSTSSTGKIFYALNGATTFENIEFSSWNDYVVDGGSFYIVAQHNPLVMGENITIDYMRNTLGQAFNTCSPLIIGGCYHNKYYFNSNLVPENASANGACNGKGSDITLYSGSYYQFVGGTVNGTCGYANGTIDVKILGDVSFRSYFVLGSFEPDTSNDSKAGDIVFTLDGSLSTGSYFSIAGSPLNPKYTSNGTKYCDNSRTHVTDVNNVVLKLYSGAIAFFNAETSSGATNSANRPIGVAYGYFDNYEDSTADYDITRHVKSLKIYYDAANPGSKGVASLFLNAPHTKTIEMSVIEGKLCSITNGNHEKGALVESVPSKCSAQGYEVYECANGCGEKFTVALEAVSHTFGEKEVASVANCINPEIMKEVCSVCGYIQYSEGTTLADPNAHTFGDDDVCDVCTQSRQDLCEHVWDGGVDVTTGCGVGKMYTCTKQCGKTRTEITGASHNFGKYSVTVQPTETEPGVKSRKCKSCGTVETALIYAEGGAMNSEAIAVDSTGALADVAIATSKLTKAEKASINALLQDTVYGAEVKVSYDVDGNVTGITYSIPLPAEFAEMQNLQIVVKDEEGNLHVVQFNIEKGYMVFTY